MDSQSGVIREQSYIVMIYYICKTLDFVQLFVCQFEMLAFIFSKSVFLISVVVHPVGVPFTSFVSFSRMVQTCKFGHY